MDQGREACSNLISLLQAGWWHGHQQPVAANAAVQGHASQEKLISSGQAGRRLHSPAPRSLESKADQDSEAMKRLQVRPGPSHVP